MYCQLPRDSHLIDKGTIPQKSKLTSPFNKMSFLKDIFHICLRPFPEHSHLNLFSHRVILIVLHCVFLSLSVMDNSCYISDSFYICIELTYFFVCILSLELTEMHCNSLALNCPSWVLCLNTWSPTSDIVLEGYG